MEKTGSCHSIKNFLNDKPIVSIVTVVFNDENNIESTIKSVINQSYNNIEYIIIDGGSSDNTIDIIKKYEDYIDFWISEPDNGIYDAMNKGIDYATGDWINFMNSGDLYNNETTIDSIFATDHEKVSFIYGKYIVRYDGFSHFVETKKITELRKGMFINHQTLFVKLPLHKKNKFDLTKKIGADYEFVYKEYIMGHKFHDSQIVIASITPNGYSDKNRVEAFIEHYRTSVKYKNSFFAHVYFIFYIFEAWLRTFIKSLLPKKMILPVS